MKPKVAFQIIITLHCIIVICTYYIKIIGDLICSFRVKGKFLCIYLSTLLLAKALKNVLMLFVFSVKLCTEDFWSRRRLFCYASFR